MIELTNVEPAYKFAVNPRYVVTAVRPGGLEVTRVELTTGKSFLVKETPDEISALICEDARQISLFGEETA